MNTSEWHEKELEAANAYIAELQAENQRLTALLDVIAMNAKHECVEISQANWVLAQVHRHAIQAHREEKPEPDR